MKSFEVEYTTNVADRRIATIEAENKTAAYLKFVFGSPKHYAITNLTERN